MTKNERVDEIALQFDYILRRKCTQAMLFDCPVSRRGHGSIVVVPVESAEVW